MALLFLSACAYLRPLVMHRLLYTDGCRPSCARPARSPSLSLVAVRASRVLNSKSTSRRQSRPERWRGRSVRVSLSLSVTLISDSRVDSLSAVYRPLCISEKLDIIGVISRCCWRTIFDRVIQYVNLTDLRWENISLPIFSLSLFLDRQPGDCLII